MAENDNKRYFWLKLKKDFFQQHQIKILKSLPNGRLYALIYLELLAESTSHEGELRYSDTIPYELNTLACVIDEDIDNVRCAIDALIKLELIEIEDDKTIFMREIQKLLGSESHSAERMREWRKNKQISDVSHCDNLSQNCHLEYRDKSKEYRDKNTTTTAPPTPTVAEQEKRTEELSVVVKETTNRTVEEKAIIDCFDKYMPMRNMSWDITAMEYLNKLPLDVIKYAINETMMLDRPSVQYLRNILLTYIKNNIKSIEDINKQAMEHIENREKTRKEEEELRKKTKKAYIEDVALKKEKAQKSKRDTDRPIDYYSDIGKDNFYLKDT